MSKVPAVAKNIDNLDERNDRISTVITGRSHLPQCRGLGKAYPKSGARM